MKIIKRAISILDWKRATTGMDNQAKILAILYYLLPSILSAMGLTVLLPALLPIGSGSPVLSILSGLLQTILMLALLVQRYRKI